jgi:hypothetical protein
MADLTPTAGKDGVYQIETDDLVQGGAGGIANDPHQNLVNRSELIFDALDGTISNANIAVLGDITIMGDTGATTEEAFKIDTTTDGTRLTYISQRLKIWSDTTVEGGQLTFTDKDNAEAWHIDVGSTSNLRIVDGSANTFMEMNGTEIVFNESGIDRNFRIEGDTDANLIFCDAGQDNIGIGTATPTSTKKVDVVSALAYGVFAVTSSATGGAAAVRGDATNAAGALNYGGQFFAAGTTGRGVEGIAENTGAVTNNGGYFEAKGATGRGAYCWHSHATGAGYGMYGVTASTSASAAGVRGDGTNASSHDFLALNGEYDSVSLKSVKVGKQNVNIPDLIRAYPNFRIQKYSYKFNDKPRELITPYADEFQEAFELTESTDNENLNVSCVAGVAFGGVVQLVQEIDKLKEEIRLLKESK